MDAPAIGLSVDSRPASCFDENFQRARVGGSSAYKTPQGFAKHPGLICVNQSNPPRS